MKRWRLVVLLLALAAAGSMAFAGTLTGQGVKSAHTLATPPDSAETALLNALSRQLAAETDRMTLGFAQMRLNAASAEPDRR